MSGARRGKRWILVGGILAVLAIDLFVARIYFHDDGRHERYLARTRQERQSTPELDESPTGSFTKRAVESVAVQATDPDPDLARVGTGVLHLRVHDGMTGVAVAGATCVVYAERHGEHQYGVLKTDADGRATIEHLPENTILIHVLRDPPHASGYGGVWLRKGTTRELDIALTAGGSVFGHAIDDVHHPVANADVLLASQRWMPDFPRNAEPELVAHTDIDGRFEVPCVISDPVIVWIKNGEMRPEYWGDVDVLVRAGLSSGGAGSEVPDGARVDLGDVIVPRERTYAGRVLDAHREPVAGALVDIDRYVSKELRFDLPPEASSFAASGADQTVTAADGSFELRCGESRETAVVTTRDGFLQSFALPKATPGARASDLELMLADDSILEIELVNEQGKRVLAGTSIGPPYATMMVSPEVPSDFDLHEMQVTLALGEDVYGPLRIRSDRDGCFRLQSKNDVGAPRRVRFAISGYMPVDEEIGAQTRVVDRHRFTVRPMPTVRVHVRVAEQPRGSPEYPMLNLHACMIDPDRRAKRLPDDSRCCGLGSSWSGVPSGADADVSLPVLAPGRYWIYAYVSAGHPVGGSDSWCLWEQHFGPFLAEDGVHDIEVPPIEPDPEPVRRQDDEDKRATAPDRSEPHASPVQDSNVEGSTSAEQSEPSPRLEGVATIHHVASKRTHSIEVSIDGAIKPYPFASVRAWLTKVGGEWSDPDSIELDPALPLLDGTRRFRAELSETGEFRIVVRSMLLQPLSQTITVNGREGTQRFALTSVR